MDRPIAYEEVQRELKMDPLKPNKTSRIIDRADQKLKRMHAAWKQAVRA